MHWRLKSDPEKALHLFFKMKLYDTRFTFDFVPRRYQDRVQRSTTLDHIYPPQPGLDQDRQTLTRVKKLNGLWRMALDGLQSAGWCRGPVDSSPEKVARDFQFLRNCPPTWAKVNQRTRCCRIDHFCPFCYSRWIGEIWSLVVNQFPAATNEPLDESQLSAQQRYDLIVRARSINLPFISAPEIAALAAATSPTTAVKIQNLDLSTAREWLRDYLKLIPPRRRALIAAVRATAGSDISAVISTIVVPTASCWRITTRSIFVIPQSAEFPTALCDGCDWYERFEHPSHSKLHKTVSKLLAYPRELLRGDPRLVATMLRARHGIHLNAKIGGFYGLNDE